MIWAEEETLSRDEIEALQLDLLKKQVKRAYEKMQTYREKMDEAGVKPEDIKSLEDLAKLPIVYKEDFRKNYPYGMLAVDKSEIVRTHASSGTTGKPTVVGYTKKDIEMWNETVKRVVVMAGARPGYTAQISFGYGMFTGGFGLHYGLENLGCNIIPMSTGNTDRQIMFMKDLGTDLIIATPSYLLHLTETIVKNGFDPKKDFNLKAGILGGEALSEKMRDELNSYWGDDVLFTQNYGMSELNGPGVAGECKYKCGMHINEDYYIAEVIDPETEEVLDDGEEGVLVITCLQKDAIPLIRYKTSDITRLHKDKCQCGRTTLRIEPFKGRSDDMLLIRGVNVFPTQIEEAIKDIDEIGPSYEIIVDRINHMDVLEVKVELMDYRLLESYGELEKLEERIVGKIKNAIGLSVKVKILGPRSLERFEGKAKRVTDKRK